MPKVSVNHTSLEYIEQGNGDPLVLVHGSASDYRTWQPQKDELGKRYRVIAYSRRYHQPNEPILDGIDYSMTEQLDDLQGLLDSLSAVPAHLVGHSYGAFLCLLLAIREPNLVRSLVLAEPPVITLFVSNTPKPLEILKLMVTRPRTAAAILKFGATGISPATAAAEQDDMIEAMRLFGTAVLGREYYGQLSESRLEQVHANSIKTEFLGSGFARIDADQIRDVHIPTLLLNGEHSPALFHRLTDRLEELLPRCERLKIPAASHIMHEDNPSAYSEAVLSFLANNK